jgi:hypothetical protein
MTVQYIPLVNKKLWWCNTHQRWATHEQKKDGGMSVPHCDPKKGGIMMPCFCVLRFDGKKPL